MTDPREKAQADRGNDEAPEMDVVREAADADAEVSAATEDETASAATAGDAAEAPALTAEELLRSERDEFQEKWLRVVAELDNVRKRNRREIVESRRFAQADVLRSLLDIQDNFERALQSVDPDSDTAESQGFREGVELIFQNLRGVLKDKGVVPIEALEQEFDPNVHEAVGTLPRDGVEPGQVIEVVQQGFLFGDMVLRPSRVIISS